MHSGGARVSPALPFSPAPTGVKTGPVQAPELVQGFLGDTVMLPCSQPLEADTHLTQVTWMQHEPEGGVLNIAVLHSSRGTSVSDPERVKFVASKPGVEVWNASLLVSELRAADEANYTCQFATFPQGSKSARIRLRVLAKPQNKIEALETPPSLPPGEPVRVACCMSQGGRPPSQINWTSPLNATTVHESQMPGLQPGTTNVTSYLMLVPSSQADGQNVTCIVQSESFEKPVRLTKTLTVHYPPEVSISGYDDNWYSGRRNVTLRCDVRSNPAPTGYEWSTTTGPLPPSTVAQGPLLTILEVNETINQTLVCQATNSLGTGRGELTPQLRATPSKDQPSGIDSTTLISIIVPIVSFILIIGGGLAAFYRKRRSSRAHPAPQRSGASWPPKPHISEGQGGVWCIG
ncbi:poliovirus receptor [Ochotona princeps]|uniref:poliovirus receptor n=1 Tax=Ochotona princeps TaxID=9978 RepID=UPI0027154F75|nr:poliovirus receptor [Ochotona princeps]